MLVYIVCSYDEGGPEDIRVTIDVNRVRGILSDVLRKEANEVLKIHGEWKREDVARYLAEVMLNFSCVDMRHTGSHKLASGYGGHQLHIVELEDGDGVALTSISHPINPGGLRGRRLKKASLETVQIEVKDG